VSLESLLTFTGILAAIVAISRPVQRRSLKLFVPVWPLAGAMLLSFGLILCRDAPLGVRPPFGWPLSLVPFVLTTTAFSVPVGATLWSWLQWHQAKLTGKRIMHVEEIFRAALREREFDEVERIVRKNQVALEELPPSAASVLFSPAMVRALVDSHSLVHLELLSHIPFLASLENRFGAVDSVVRELLLSDASPLRSAVVSVYGGLERLTYSNSQRALFERTFQNPRWYLEAQAHYPLVISAVEALRSGEFDTAYNDLGRDYEADQGVSSRARCPVYLAMKTEVLAIKAGIRDGSDEDFYVTDLWDIFRHVHERSKFDESIWESSLGNWEFPTPYAYLLYEIVGDIDDLSGQAVQKAAHGSQGGLATKPGRLARDLAMTWSFCTWCVATSENEVSSQFRSYLIKRNLLFILALGWGVSEICDTPGGGHVGGLDAWRDLFLSELQERFRPMDGRGGAALREAFESLDLGKLFVFHGHEWLGEKLFGIPTEKNRPA